MARTVRVPAGADLTRYYPGIGKDIKRRRFGPERTPEQIAEDSAKSHAAHTAFMRRMAPQWGVAAEDIDLWTNDPDAYRQKVNQERAVTKLVDREARIAVEGDTDLNHDNVEEAE